MKDLTILVSEPNDHKNGEINQEAKTEKIEAQIDGI